ncbi:MAG: hypothetical protein ACOCP8_06550 [archaeon]
MKMLLLGPKHHISGQMGGVVISFEKLIEELNIKKIDYIVVDINKNNYKNIFIALTSIFYKIMKNIPKISHVSLHGTVNDFIYIAPFLVLISKISNKKISLRKFGGNFIYVYETSNFLQKKLIRYALKNSSAIFFQTKYLVNYFARFNKNTHWMPTARAQPITTKNKQ